MFTYETRWNIIDVEAPNVLAYENRENQHQLYCWLIKEHVQHFSKQSIQRLFKDYYLYSYEEYDYEEGNHIIPSFKAVFTKFNPDGFYFYGAGRDFLYSHLNLKCAGIIDNKHAGKTVNGVKIFPEDIIQYLSGESQILITSWFYKNEMKEKLSSYKGRVI